MGPVLQNLQARYYPYLSGINFDDYDLSKLDELNNKFTALLNESDKVFNTRLLSDQLLLSIEYSVLCQQLQANLSNPNPDKKEELKDALVSAFIFSSLLEHIHSPQDPENLQNQQSTFKFLLSDPATNIRKKLPKKPIVLTARQVRNLTARTTWYRLFINRLKRLIEVIAMIGTGWQWFQDFAAFLTKYVGPVLSYVAWIFFIPRLFVNFLSLVDSSMYGWDIFIAQLILLFPDIANDLPWFVVGLVNCFHFTGSLSPFAPSLTLIFYGHDLFMACSNAFVELRRLYTLVHEYKNIKTNACSDFQKHLYERIQFESLRLSISITVASFVFIGGIGALTTLSSWPIIPLLGAITLIVASLMRFIADIILANYRPKDTPEKLPNIESLPLRLGFFSTRPPPLSVPNSNLETRHSNILYSPA